MISNIEMNRFDVRSNIGTMLYINMAYRAHILISPFSNAMDEILNRFQCDILLLFLKINDLSYYCLFQSKDMPF